MLSIRKIQPLRMIIIILKTSLAYELSDSLVALINGTNNPSNNSINNLYSSLTTFNATKLSSDNFICTITKVK